jgi:hypothetical protein
VAYIFDRYRIPRDRPMPPFLKFYANTIDHELKFPSRMVGMD